MTDEQVNEMRQLIGEQIEQGPKPVTAALTGKRANWTIAHKIEGTKIHWTVKGAGTLTLDTAAISEANRTRAMLHGMVQRISDAAAISRDSETGKSASPQEKYDSMASLVDHYLTGTDEWSLKRESTAGRQSTTGLSGVSLLRAALAIQKPSLSPEKILEWTKKLTQKEVLALLASKELKEAVELARADAETRALEGLDVNAEELLKGL